MEKVTDKRKVFIIIAILAAIIVIAFIVWQVTDNANNSAWTSDCGLPNDVRIENFAKEFGILPEDIARIDESNMLSIMAQTEAYGFSAEQVQALVALETNGIEEPNGMEGTLSEDGKYFIYPNGWTMPNRYSHLTEQLQE